MKLQKPSNGIITSKMGWRGKHYHAGIDIAAGVGSPIRAVANGIVIKAVSGCSIGYQRCGSGLGNHVVVDHKNGYYTCYAHLTTLGVKQGQRVKSGDVIGTEGNTGYSFGSHLHLELRTNLKLAKQEGAVDPYPYLYGNKELPNAEGGYWLEVVAVIALVGVGYWAYKKGVLKKISSKLRIKSG